MKEYFPYLVEVLETLLLSGVAQVLFRALREVSATAFKMMKAQSAVETRLQLLEHRIRTAEQDVLRLQEKSPPSFDDSLDRL